MCDYCRSNSIELCELLQFSFAEKCGGALCYANGILQESLCHKTSGKRYPVRNRSELYIKKFTNSSQKNWHSLLTSAKNGGITYLQEGKRSGALIPGFLNSPCGIYHSNSPEQHPGPKIKGGLTYVVHAWYFW